MQYSVILQIPHCSSFFASLGLIYFITGILYLLTSLHPFQWVGLFLDLPLPVDCDILIFPGFSFCHPDHSLLRVCVLVAQVMSDSLRTHRLQPVRLLWDSPDKNIGVGCHLLLQGIFLTQGSNPGLCMAGRFFTI